MPFAARFVSSCLIKDIQTHPCYFRAVFLSHVVLLSACPVACPVAGPFVGYPGGDLWRLVPGLAVGHDAHSLPGRGGRRVLGLGAHAVLHAAGRPVRLLHGILEAF